MENSGQAFPTQETSQYIGDPGMSLREYYAGAAMQGLLSACDATGEFSPEDIASLSRRMADALLEELKK